MSKDKSENLGDIVFKLVRSFYGIGQGELALSLNSSQSYIAKIENKYQSPCLNVWFNLIRTYGVTDPYCFYTGEIYFKSEVFESLKTEGSRLLPNINFNQDIKLITVLEFKNYIKENKRYNEKKLLDFSKKRSIKYEVWRINNHPIPQSLKKEAKHFLDMT